MIIDKRGATIKLVENVEILRSERRKEAKKEKLKNIFFSKNASLQINEANNEIGNIDNLIKLFKSSFKKIFPIEINIPRSIDSEIISKIELILEDVEDTFLQFEKSFKNFLGNISIGKEQDLTSEQFIEILIVDDLIRGTSGGISVIMMYLDDVFEKAFEEECSIKEKLSTFQEEICFLAATLMAEMILIDRTLSIVICDNKLDIGRSYKSH